MGVDDSPFIFHFSFFTFLGAEHDQFAVLALCLR